MSAGKRLKHAVGIMLNHTTATQDVRDELVEASNRAADEIERLEAEAHELRSAIFGSELYDRCLLKNGNFVEMVRATEDGRRGALDRAWAAEAREAVLRGGIQQTRARLIDLAWSAALSTKEG